MRPSTTPRPSAPPSVRWPELKWRSRKTSRSRERRAGGDNQRSHHSLIMSSATNAFLLIIISTAVVAGCTKQEAPPSTAAPASTAVVLRNVTLIDGNGGAPLANAALVIDNGRIQFAGPSSDLQAPAGASVQDLTGKFIMPGIINAHGHIAESDGVTQDPKQLFTRDNVHAHLKLYASYGVTTVVSMGTDQPLVYEIRDEQRARQPAEARVFTAGRGFTAKGG